jgi:hypothetical protein
MIKTEKAYADDTEQAQAGTHLLLCFVWGLTKVADAGGAWSRNRIKAPGRDG